MIDMARSRGLADKSVQRIGASLDTNLRIEEVFRVDKSAPHDVNFSRTSADQTYC